MKHYIVHSVLFASVLPLVSCGPVDGSHGSTPIDKENRATDTQNTRRSTKTPPAVSENLGTVEIALAPGSMPLKTFWKIIEVVAAVHESDIEQQEESLGSELRELSDDELIAFKVTYEQVMDEAYVWDLWAAAYFCGGGCSDDGFTYFRNWLIGRGEHAFYNALNNPDSLAIFDLDGEFDLPMGCEWDLLPSTIWDERHPSGPDLYDQLPDKESYLTEPKGEQFDEDDIEAFKVKFPRLFEAYSHLWN